MTIYHKIALVLTYIILSLSVIGYFDSAGYGSYAPSVILLSWPWILGHLNWTPLNLIIPLLIYVVTLISIEYIFPKKIVLSIYKIFVGLHVSCTFLYLFMNPNRQVNLTWFNSISIISSFFILAIFFFVFYVQLKTNIY